MGVKEINLSGWQDYRGDHAGILLYVESSSQADLPVRDILNENGKGALSEPNYETATYGLLGNFNTRAINSIIKNKHRYILFATRYQGVELEYKKKFLIHGFMRIDKVKDVRQRHIHNYMRGMVSEEPECMTMDQAMACWSGDMQFFALADAFELNEEVMKKWGYKGRITKQMKLLLEGEKLDELLDWFKEKDNIIDEYIGTVEEMKDIDVDEEEEDDDDW
jgi:hypothetical protein